MYNSFYRFGLTIFMFILIGAVIEVFLVPFLSLLWLLSFSAFLMSLGMLALISRAIRKDYERSLHRGEGST